MKIKIEFPDHNVKEFAKGVSALDIAKSISENFSQKVFAASLDGKVMDMKSSVEKSGKIVFHTFDDDLGKEIYWHSTAHLMAQAVKELWPAVKVTIGPSIEQGFYYDFDREEAFTDADLENIEKKMEELVKGNFEYTRKEISKEEAIAYFESIDEPYKVEILKEIPDGEIISTYNQGSFTDLCRGPHIGSTGKIKAFKLLKTSGAYWRGNEKNKMLKRIYGISYPGKKELAKYLSDLEEAKKRDHRKIGKDLDLFSISDEVGAGLVLWHPNGAMMRHIIESYWKEKHLEADYKLVYTPHIGKSDLWVTSGHLGFYNDSMYSPMDIDGQDYIIKPMNCPFHISIYKTAKRSYRELPLRYAEMGTVYRYERSGTLHGLMRVRGFTQDDAHIICAPEEVMEEVESILDFSMTMLRSFGFKDFMLYLSTKPEKSVGDVVDWDKATASLRNALEKHKLEYQVDEGGGAFYGPKIDIKIKDALGRAWQCTTIQFDFNLPERFDMEYIGKDNLSHRPFMIHRALFGSMERFFGTLVEYYAGNFPTWLCPVQAIVLPISENSEHYAKRVKKRLAMAGIRAEVDLRSEKIGYKIREAEMRKIPFMMVVGSKEEDANTVGLRRHKYGDMGSFDIDKTIDMIKGDIQSHSQKEIVVNNHKHGLASLFKDEQLEED